MSAEDALLSFRVMAITIDAGESFMTSLEIAVELKRRFDYVIDTEELRKKMTESPLIRHRDYGCALPKDQRYWHWESSDGGILVWNESQRLTSGIDPKRKP